MSRSNDAVIERVRIREVAGIFRTHADLDATVDDLLRSGFHAADMAFMRRDAVRREFGFDIPPGEISDVLGIPRRSFFPAAEDVALIAGMGVGILMFAGAALGAFAVVASGGSSAAEVIAALLGGTVVGGIGAWIIRRLRREHAPEIDIPNTVGEFVLFVRVRSSERENKARQILLAHGAEAVRVHEIEIDKRLEDIPLSSLHVDPWLGDERPGDL
jgi:outer membrane lipoprotein SlyB